MQCAAPHCLSEADPAGQRPIAAAAVLQRLNAPGMPAAASLANLSRPGHHNGLTPAQLDAVADEGVPTAIRYAVWKGQQRKRGRRMVEARRRLVEYYKSTP